MQLPGGPLVIPPRRGLKPKSAPALLSLAQEAAFEKLAVRLGARIEPQQKSRDHVRVAPRVARQLAGFAGQPLIAPRPGPPVPEYDEQRVDDELEDPGGPTRELPMEDDLTPTPAAPGAEPEPEEIQSSEVEVVDEDDGRRRGPVPQPDPGEPTPRAAIEVVDEDDRPRGPARRPESEPASRPVMDVVEERRTAELRVELGEIGRAHV